jgi:hypothetical protein
MFSSELELDVSPESLHLYKEIAYRHLNEHNSTVDVAIAGIDQEGDEIFGIRLMSDEGEEEWYDPDNSGEDTMVGWKDRDEAYAVLENKILPNIGYALFQQELKQFHQNMIYV